MTKMFLPTGSDFSPYGGKNLRHLQRMRGFVRRHHGPTGPAFSKSNYYPISDGPGPWPQRVARERDTMPPLEPPNELENDNQRSKSRSRSDASTDHSRGRRPTLSSDRKQSVPFDQAAVRLDNAFVDACRITERYQREFEKEIQDIAVYADIHTLNHIWKLKLNWDGRDTATYNTKSVRSITYREAMEQLEEAIRGFRNSQPPQWSSDESLNPLSLEETRFILRKLSVGIQSIHELVDLVGEKRDRMNILHKELVSTHKLLLEIQDFWCAEKKRKQHRCRMQASFEDDPFEQEWGY